MTTQKAIEKAIEGGWLPHKAWKGIERKAIIKWCSQGEMHISFVVMQRSFWQALGKSMGWKDLNPQRGHYFGDWLNYQHCFIDHLAEKKSIESYFEQL